MKAKTVLIIIAIILCLAIIGSLGNTGVKPSRDAQVESGGTQAATEETPISATQATEETPVKQGPSINQMYDSIKTAMTLNEVRKVLGEPTRVQKMEVDVGQMANMEEIKRLTGEQVQTKSSFEYWYYMQAFNMLQIGFTDGKVSSRMIT